MRQGISPAKRAGLPAHVPAEVGMVSLVFIPSLVGFYAQSLEVLGLHLDSLRRTLPTGEILVWDNGSCPQVVELLQQRFRQGQIDYLVLSQHNVGKAGVLNWILSALPHRYIGFSDGDILFLKGWWSAVQEVFRAFPKAGMVSPAPAFFDVLRGKSTTASLLQEAGFRVYTDTPTARDVQLYYQGLGHQVPEQPPILPLAQAPDGTLACARSGHHVFVMPREVARQIPPLPVDRALSRDSDRVLHERVEQLEYWQLSTARSFVYHLGNTVTLPDLLATEVEGEESAPPRSPARPRPKDAPTGLKGVLREGLRRAMVRFPRLRKNVERVYDALFRLLYGEV